MLVLFFMVIDFGRTIHDVQVIAGLSRQGSNLASRGTSLSDSATAVVEGDSSLNDDKISQAFLPQVANDPASSTFYPNTPVGEAVFAPTAADLQGVFQTIASEILLRLSR
jgi:hypothetical protein